jgi:hypothetical protein
MQKITIGVQPSAFLPAERLLAAAEVQGLAEVALAVEWVRQPRQRTTRRSYENALKDFVRFTGIARADEFRAVTAHVIAWRFIRARKLLAVPYPTTSQRATRSRDARDPAAVSRATARGDLQAPGQELPA